MKTYCTWCGKPSPTGHKNHDACIRRHHREKAEQKVGQIRGVFAISIEDDEVARRSEFASHQSPEERDRIAERERISRMLVDAALEERAIQNMTRTTKTAR